MLRIGSRTSWFYYNKLMVIQLHHLYYASHHLKPHLDLSLQKYAWVSFLFEPSAWFFHYGQATQHECHSSSYPAPSSYFQMHRWTKMDQPQVVSLFPSSLHRLYIGQASSPLRSCLVKMFWIYQISKQICICMRVALTSMLHLRSWLSNRKSYSITT